MVLAWIREFCETPMEKLHVATLVLEMIGFGLAYIHVFRERIASRANKFVINIPEVLLSGVNLMGADSDKSIPLKQRDAIAINNNIFRLAQLAAIIVFFRLFNFGHGFLWGVAEFLCAMIVSFPVALLFVIILALAAKLIVGLAVQSGRGHVIVGTGFFLAAGGIVIETYQVWESPYRGAALALWGLITLLVLGTMLRRKQGPRPSNGE